MWITIFLMITASPVFTYFFLGQYVDSKNYENRNMASKPILTAENYELFPKEYEAYYNDNLPFRNQLIRFHNSIDYFLFKQSSSERVAIGKNGWLFYCDKTNGNPIEQSLGYWNFTSSQLQTIANNLMSAKRVLESQGIEFVLFIAPNKETIYMDELPDYYEVKSSYTSTDQLIDYLTENTDIRVVYPKQDLLNMKKNLNMILYHKLDTHWNYAGAYIGAKSLAEELGINMPSLNEISLKSISTSSGDLTKMLNITIKNGDNDYNISDISTLNTINEKRILIQNLFTILLELIPVNYSYRETLFQQNLLPVCLLNLNTVCGFIKSILANNSYSITMQIFLFLNLLKEMKRN